MLNNDKELKRRQGMGGRIAIFAKSLYIDKLIFDFFKIPFPYMKLIKPMYRQIDAPREWFMEATRRLIKCEFTVHPLDPCFFMAFGQNKNLQSSKNNLQMASYRVKKKKILINR